MAPRKTAPAAGPAPEFLSPDTPELWGSDVPLPPEDAAGPPCTGCGGQVQYAGRGRRPSRCSACAAAKRDVPPKRAAGVGTDKAAQVARSVVTVMRSAVDVGSKLAVPQLEEIWAPHWDGIQDALTANFRAHKGDMAKFERGARMGTRGAVLAAVVVPTITSVALIGATLAARPPSPRRARRLEARAERQAARTAARAPRTSAGAPGPSSAPGVPADRPLIPDTPADLLRSFGGV